MSEAVATFEARDFARGFVAGLVMEGASSIQPMNPAHRHGMYRVYQYIEDEVAKAESGGLRDRFKALVRIRNRIEPGQTGAFDQFQTDLRDLQLSLTESPNPSYEDISFSLSQPFAQSLLQQLGDANISLIRGAVKCFLRESVSGDVPREH